MDTWAEYKKNNEALFFKNANNKFGKKFDFSKVIYKNNKTKVEIICKINNHLSFFQTPNNHLRGHKCPKCKGEKLRKINTLSLNEFIKTSKEIHGDKYDYSKVKYKNMHTKVCIICKNHDEPYEFLQKPNDHVSGHGCPKCARNQKLTLEEFIEMANMKHGYNKYDYSNSIYIDGNTSIEIICPKEGHGSFWQKPYLHLQGRGCPLCGHEKRAENNKLTLEEFIEKANKVHGIGTYDYSESKYIDSQTKIKIICSKHGVFLQRPANHLNGQGCPKCNNYKGEIAVRRFLINNNIEFEEQKKFKDCKDKRLLPFDFYLPQYNICIEFDGRQHFNPTSFNSKNTTEEEKLENFKIIQKHDKIKNDYCKLKRITLIRLRNVDTVEKELLKYLELTNPLDKL